MRLEEVREAAARARPLAWYRPGRTVVVADRMQRNYTYRLAARRGRDFAPGFEPELTPAQMLRRGVFEGKYCNDCTGELPREWFAGALRAGRLAPERADPAVNEFGVKSRKSLGYWRRAGWLPITATHNVHHVIARHFPGRAPAEFDLRDHDVRGWFQWYCRYWLGRRQPVIDQIQIARWRAFRRHRAQLLLGCARRHDPRCRPVQRQALLQWAYDPMP